MSFTCFFLFSSVVSQHHLWWHQHPCHVQSQPRTGGVCRVSRDLNEMRSVASQWVCYNLSVSHNYKILYIWYIYMHMYVYIYKYQCIYISTNVCIDVNIYIYTWLHMCVCVTIGHQNIKVTHDDTRKYLPNQSKSYPLIKINRKSYRWYHFLLVGGIYGRLFDLVYGFTPSLRPLRCWAMHFMAGIMYSKWPCISVCGHTCAPSLCVSTKYIDKQNDN